MHNQWKGTKVQLIFLWRKRKIYSPQTGWTVGWLQHILHRLHSLSDGVVWIWWGCLDLCWCGGNLLQLNLWPEMSVRIPPPPTPASCIFVVNTFMCKPQTFTMSAGAPRGLRVVPRTLKDLKKDHISNQNELVFYKDHFQAGLCISMSL